ncbi:tumor necrosis factor receptor superfamily member 5-like isoform X2 [Xyrichtys novacula]|uniref:Tumor necrosis factor receptor superfamily member 5-like isoform X2 n=1 Tax=Xyrichtys novacula TaxID=13765 RepID=A0AAV1F2C4_XYRNO|nr:tumor necrosis factor receptor superfamily member 5-like isoform X2 [Xyrichtys novacula]
MGLFWACFHRAGYLFLSRDMATLHRTCAQFPVLSHQCRRWCRCFGFIFRLVLNLSQRMFSNQNCDPDEEMMLETKLWLLLTICTLKIFTGQTLTCHRTEYQIGNECCPMCGIGSRVAIYCTESYSTRCLPCTEGTFMDQETDHRQCYPCTKCDAGSGLRTETSCTNTSDAVCQPLEGFFCIESAEGGCAAAKRHTSCKPGEYISQNGSSVSDTVCSPCSDGSFSDGTFSSCRPHTQCESKSLQQLVQGTESSDAQCGERDPDWTGVIVCGLVFWICYLVIPLVFCFTFVGNEVPKYKRS